MYFILHTPTMYMWKKAILWRFPGAPDPRTKDGKEEAAHQLQHRLQEAAPREELGEAAVDVDASPVLQHFQLVRGKDGGTAGKSSGRFLSLDVWERT